MSQVTRKHGPWIFVLPSRIRPIMDLWTMELASFSDHEQNTRDREVEWGGSLRLLQQISRGGSESTPPGGFGFAPRINPGKDSLSPQVGPPSNPGSRGPLDRWDDPRGRG